MLSRVRLPPRMTGCAATGLDQFRGLVVCALGIDMFEQQAEFVAADAGHDNRWSETSA